MTDLPGDPIAIPLPPALAETLGYRGDARFVGVYFTPMGDEVVTTDGASSGSGATWSYLAFKRHPAVRGQLANFDLGSSEEDAAHMLVLDRAEGKASVAPVAEAREFLAAQHPELAPPTPEEAAAIRERVEQLMKEWREAPVDWDAVARQQREQATRMAVMLAFLDQQVPPGQGPTP